MQAGTRCSGCGRRIGLGIRFFSIDPRDETGQVVRMCACAREDCDFAEVARAGATYMEMLELVWLDDMGMDAPPIDAIVKRSEARRAAVAEAAERQAESN